MNNFGTGVCAIYLSSRRGVWKRFHGTFLYHSQCYDLFPFSSLKSGCLCRSVGAVRRYSIWRTPLVLADNRKRKPSPHAFLGTISPTAPPPSPSPSPPSSSSSRKAPARDPILQKMRPVEPIQQPRSPESMDSPVVLESTVQSQKKTPKHRKKREGIAIATSLVETIVVDAGAVVSEWQSLTDTKALSGVIYLRSVSRTLGTAILASNSNVHTETYVKPPNTTPNSAPLEGLTGFLAQILKDPDHYPQMHSLFDTAQHISSSSPAGGRGGGAVPLVKLTLNNVSTILSGARNEHTLLAFLSFLRMYRRVSKQSVGLMTIYRKLVEEFLREVSRAWGVILAGVSGIEETLAVMRQCAWVLLELYCLQLDDSTRFKVTSEARKPSVRSALRGEGDFTNSDTSSPFPASSSKRRVRKEAGSDNGVRKSEAYLSSFDWKLDMMRAFLEEAVHPIFEKLQNTTIAEDSTYESKLICDLAFQYYFVLLIIELRKMSLVGEHAKSTVFDPKTHKKSKGAEKVLPISMWDSVAEQKRRAVEETFSYFAQKDPAHAEQVFLETCNARLEDSLLALHVSQAFALVVPHDFQQFLQMQATQIVHRFCQAVEYRPDIFLFMCTEAFTHQLEQLKECPGSPYRQMCTDIFTAAGFFLRSYKGSISDLLNEKETTRWATVRARTLKSSEAARPTRPLLHGVAMQLLYVMLCVGYSPDVVLQNALYLFTDPLELASITSAAALFSTSFATSPLPARLSTTLLDICSALARVCAKSARCLALSQAAVATKTRQGHKSLSSRLDGLSTMQISSVRHVGLCETASNVDRAKRTPFNDETSASKMGLSVTAKPSPIEFGEVVTQEEMNQVVDRTLYMALSATVEFLTRGDESASRNLILSLFPVLEMEGSVVYLVEALELLTAKVAERLAQIGTMEMRSASSSDEAASVHHQSEKCVTSLRMEQCFVEIVALFQQRIATNLSNRLTGTSDNKGCSSFGSLLPQPTVSAESSSSLSGRPTGRAKKVNLRHSTAALPPTAPRCMTSLALSLDELQQLIFRFTVSAVTCGMDVNAVKQLTSLHTTLLRTKDGVGVGMGSDKKTTSTTTGTAIVANNPLSQEPTAEDTVHAAIRVVEQLHRLITCVAEKRFPIVRHPQSAHVRTTSTALNHIVAVNLTSISPLSTRVCPPRAGIENKRATTLSKIQHRFVLSVIHLLFRLATNYPVEAEPAPLRVFRTDVLDPAVAQLLSEHLTNRSSDSAHGPADELSLTTLSEIAVVMCAPHTIHLVSRDLYTSLSSVVVKTMNSGRRIDTRNSATGAVVQRLLCACSAICLRGDTQLTTCFIDMLESAQPCLTLCQSLHVLDVMFVHEVPALATPLTVMLKRLVQALSEVHPKSGRPVLSLADSIATLRTLARYDGITTTTTPTTTKASTALPHYEDQKNPNKAATMAGEKAGLKFMIPYGRTLARLCRSENIQRQRISLFEYGELVRITAALSSRIETIDSCAEEEKALILKLPRLLSVPILQSNPSGMEHDIPSVLCGYAEVRNDDAVRAQVLRAFISRTIRACPMLSPQEVVQCIEAYCAAGIYHEYLFSVLLGRVADITQRFSLGLCLRLLRCGIRSGHALVKTACVTATKPVFVAHVRHILQSDPSFITSVGLTSTAILRCLRDCFPREPISAAVLENIASHKQGMNNVLVMKAALELIAVRGTMDYNTLRILAEYTTSELISTSSPRDLADLVYLLVVCGVRSGALLTSMSARFSEVRSEADGYTLARIMEVFQRGCVDIDNKLLLQLVERIIEVVRTFLSSAGNWAVANPEEVRKPGADGQSIEAPFTVSQVSIILSQLYSDGKQQPSTLLPAVDALLTYLSHLWSPSRSSILDRSYRVCAMTAREVEVILRSCVEHISDPQVYRDVLCACADQLSRLLDPTPKQPFFCDTGTETGAAIGDRVQRKTESSSTDSSFNSYLDSTADRIEGLAPESNASVTPWRGDLLMLVNLASFLTRGGEVAHPVLRSIFALVFEKRASLLKRHLLFETVKQTLKATGQEVHPELYGFVLEGKIV